MNAVRSLLEDLESCPLALCPGLVEELRASGEWQSERKGKGEGYKYVYRVYKPIIHVVV